jgi:hypothetical protein
VFVERILDVIVLTAALASVFFILLDRFATIRELFVEPIYDQIGQIPALAVGFAIIAVGVLVLLIFRQLLRSEDSALRRLWDNKARSVLASFKDGAMTLLRSKDRGAIIISTVLMWTLYLLMAHIPFMMLGMSDTYQITLADSWSIMLLGAIGVVIPSPGGTGSYHYITVQTLVHLFGVSQASAATYAVLTHAAQLVLYVLVGAACLLLQGSRLSALGRPTREEG